MTSTMTIWTGKSVPRVGLGCWAIGGTTSSDGPSTSYGAVDDATSRAALRLGYELGARVFDTAIGYGAGHSEILIGEEISRYDDAVIVTKFGYEVDVENNRNGPENVDPAHIRASLDGSRKRLKRDRIDLALLHLNTMDPDLAPQVFDTLEELVQEGKLAAYGWSTDFIPQAQSAADYPHFVAFENDYNVFTPATELMAFAQRKGKISISRLPLAMGLLTGKYAADTRLSTDDVRAQAFPWLRFFRDGKPDAAYLKRLGALRDLLQSDGRTLAQGALGWILARSGLALPVPGFKNEAQVRDNLGANEKGPLSESTMAEIDAVLSGFAEDV
ncbi:aldo/keto reductase [Mariluticola halotolerans]|uniref:aldo/keto reductase n=1 Tax=Mariluticola halotolerans TaxID=2909283 RepID=UPI0026E3361F|nr:aldo/keto reductase [Mariluticola halotolerans]UJQ94750.1 aldo/keto reductase [Mariluticola halotolerans]